MQRNRKAPTKQTTRLRAHRSRWARDAEQKKTVLRNEKLRIKDHQSRHDKNKKSRRILSLCPYSHWSSHFPQAPLPPPKKKTYGGCWEECVRSENAKAREWEESLVDERENYWSVYGRLVTL
ncbi:unnamed protein product [Ectocarpus sp. 12 AP-2014]